MPCSGVGSAPRRLTPWPLRSRPHIAEVDERRLVAITQPRTPGASAKMRGTFLNSQAIKLLALTDEQRLGY